VQNSIGKLPKAKKGKGVAQVVEYLPGTALSSNPRATKKGKLLLFPF
jgi:hypothetical protein